MFNPVNLQNSFRTTYGNRNNLQKKQPLNTMKQNQMFKSIDGKKWESYENRVIQNQKLFNSMAKNNQKDIRN